MKLSGIRRFLYWGGIGMWEFFGAEWRFFMRFFIGVLSFECDLGWEV